jgi:hypothetical protein
LIDRAVYLKESPACRSNLHYAFHVVADRDTVAGS